MLGGTTALARDLGLSPSAVSYWRREGTVPPSQHARVLALCVERGIFWRPPGWPHQVQLRFNRRAQPW
jgi:hypothetical protein